MYAVLVGSGRASRGKVACYGDLAINPQLGWRRMAWFVAAADMPNGIDRADKGDEGEGEGVGACGGRRAPLFSDLGSRTFFEPMVAHGLRRPF